jgi:hypothetical protein
MKKLDIIAKDLFDKIRSRFSEVTLADSDGTITNQPEEARFYEFSFVGSDEQKTKISIGLDAESGVTVMYGQDLLDGETQKTQNRWYSFLRELRQFAKKRFMNFDVRDIEKSNLSKRDYKFLANNRSEEEKMTESKFYGSSKTSFMDIGNAKLILRHASPLAPETQSRVRNVDSIYVESPDGERYRYPFKHITGAKALARHVSEGGNMYDDFGAHIVEMSRELGKLKTFKRYIGRGGVMAESLAGYTDQVIGRIGDIKKTLANLQKPNFYAESILEFQTRELEQVPDDVVENWIDQLTIKQFNEELKDVFPYIYRLVSEAQPKMVTPDDFADTDHIQTENQKDNTMKLEADIEEYIESLMGQFGDQELEEAAVPPGYTMARIIKKKVTKGQKRIGQMSGATVKNAKEDSFNMVAIFGNYQDPLELTAKSAEYSTAVRSPEHFIRIAQKRLQDPLHRTKGIVLFFTAAEQGSDQWRPYVDAIEELNDPKIKVNSREARQIPGGDGVKRKSKDKRKPEWGSADAKVEPGARDVIHYFTITNDKLLNFLKRRQQDYMAKYYRTAEKQFVMNDRVYKKFLDLIKSPEWEKKFGPTMTMHTKRAAENQEHSSGSKLPLSEFIMSYFDRETGRFPKGETAVLTAIEKEYGDQYVRPANQFIESVKGVYERAIQERTPSGLDDIRRLAGL